MLTKGAIGNLVNRYKAVLAKCNLINTFGSLAVASMLVLGGAGGASAFDFDHSTDGYSVYFNGSSVTAGSETETVPTDENIFIHSGEQGLHFELNAKMTSSENITLDGSYIKFIEGNEIHGKNLKITQIDQVNNDSSNQNHGGIITASESIEFTSYFCPEKMKIQAPRIIFDAAVNTYGDTSIVANEIELNSTTSLRENSSFDATLTKVTLRNKARIQLMGDNAVKFDTLVVDNSNGDEAILVDRMPNAQEGTTAFDIANVKLSEGSTLSVYATDKEEGGAVKFGNVDLNKNAELRLGWRNSDYKGTLAQKEIGTLTLAEGATVIAVDEACPEEDTAPTDSSKGTGSANIQNIIFEGGNSSVQATVEGDSTNVTVSEGVEGASINKVASKKATISVENPNNSTLSINEVTSTSNVTVTTGSENNTGDLTALAEAVAIDANNGTVTLSVAENDLYGAASGELDENGNLDASTVKQASASSLMKDALKQASVTTVALDKLLTNDVRKRLGDIRSDKNTTGVWMRWDGGKLKGDSGLTNNFNTIQIGGDTKAAKNCRIGFAGSFTHGDTEFSRGNGELEGFSFALYGTWMGENGMFADVVARLGKFSTEMNVEGRKGDMDNRVASLSGEYGWRFNLAQQFFVEPQVELAYTYVSSDDLQLGTTKFAFDSVDSLTGRAGVVAGWNLPEERGNVYARASVVQQFLGDAKISGTDGNGRGNVYETDGNDTWLEYGIGANVKLTDSTYLWADVERTEGADIEEEWRGTVGVRYSF